MQLKGLFLYVHFEGTVRHGWEGMVVSRGLQYQLHLQNIFCLPCKVTSTHSGDQSMTSWWGFIILSNIKLYFIRLFTFYQPFQYVISTSLFFPQHRIFINYLVISYSVPRSDLLPILPRSILPTFYSHKHHQVQFVLLICSLGMTKLPGASLLKKTGSFLTPTPSQKLSTLKNYTSIPVSKFLRTLFNSSLSGLYFGQGVSQKPSICLSLRSLQMAAQDISNEEW